jgi:hypothetical protein
MELEPDGVWIAPATSRMSIVLLYLFLHPPRERPLYTSKVGPIDTYLLKQDYWPVLQIAGYD